MPRTDDKPLAKRVVLTVKITVDRNDRTKCGPFCPFKHGDRGGGSCTLFNERFGELGNIRLRACLSAFGLK